MTGPRGAHAGRGQQSVEKIIRQQLTSRFVRTSRALRSWVAWAGSVLFLQPMRQDHASTESLIVLTAAYAFHMVRPSLLSARTCRPPTLIEHTRAPLGGPTRRPLPAVPHYKLVLFLPGAVVHRASLLCTRTGLHHLLGEALPVGTFWRVKVSRPWGLPCW